MKIPSFSRESVRYRITGRHSCPVCSGKLLRTWRRPVDRFSSQFVPVQRYRCESFACQWEGNFRVERASASGHRDGWSAQETSGLFPMAEDPPVQRVPRSMVVHMALAIAGVVFVVVFAATDWTDPEGSAGDTLRDGKWLASVRLAGQGTRIEPPPRKPTPALQVGAVVKE